MDMSHSLARHRHCQPTWLLFRSLDQGPINVRSGDPLLTKTELSPQTQLRDQAAIPLDVLAAKVVEQPAPFSDHEEQPAAAVMIVLVVAKVPGEVVDPLGEESYLNLGRPCVAVVRAVFGNDLTGCLHCA